MKLAIKIFLILSLIIGFSIPTSSNASPDGNEIMVAQFGLPGLGDQEDEETIEEDEEFVEDVEAEDIDPENAEAEEGDVAETDEEEDILEEDEDLPLDEPPLFPPRITIGDDEDEDKPVPRKITIDAVVYVDYQFFDSPDAFKVKYHLNMGGTANITTAIIRGSAEIATEVTGHLAKWSGGQCILNVNIAKVPYEILYNQDIDEADITVNFKRDINEVWESTCTFIGGVAKPFKSSGPVEQWISNALEKTTPPITSIVAPVEPNESSSTKFDIPEYTVVEENLGSATVKGTGVVTIQPVKKTTPRSRSNQSRSFLKPPNNMQRGNILPNRLPAKARPLARRRAN